MQKHVLYLIDGHSYLYRAFHALPPLSNSKGLPTHVIFGFTNMLYKVLREKKPDYLAVVFDSEKPTQRHRLFEAYKAHRPQMPDALAAQIPYVFRLLEAFHIPVLVEEGIEADDLIATLAVRAQREGLQIVIASSDRDLFQLVSPAVQIYDTMRDKVYDVEAVRERFGVPPEKVIEVRGLTGDASDNLPGVPGVGEKTASALIREFGSIDQLLASLEKVGKPKLREALRLHGEQARESRELSRLERALPWKGEVAALARQAPDAQALMKFFTEMEFTGLLKTLAAQERSPAPSSPERGELPCPEFTARAREKKRIGLVPWLSDSPAMRAALKGLALSCGAGESLFRPADAHDFPGEILEDPRVKKIGHGLKPLVIVLAEQGIEIRGVEFDTLLGSYLLTPNRRSHDLTEICIEYLGRPVAGLEEDQPPDRHRSALVQTSEDVLELAGQLRDRLEERGQLRLYEEVEVPLIEVLAHMERQGILIDVEQLRELSKEMDLQLEGLVRQIYAQAGGEFNINSPKQLSQVLFERLGLKPVKKTKTGYSTDEGVLTQLAQVHDLPAQLLQYRQLSKLKSTYVDVLPQLVHPRTGRLHTTFHQAVAATGRLSSSDPNLQNIPVRGEWGRRIREAFIAPPGCRLLSADYNQIELRLLAHFSGDAVLRQAFRRGEDIHAATAAGLFGRSPEQVTPDMRRVAKTVNFGVIYGMGPFGLSESLGIPQPDARDYIDRYFREHEGVRDFVMQTVESARRTGYVSTLLGRRRDVPELSGKDVGTRRLGERIAVNTVIQGSAADLIKLAMLRVFEALKEARLQSRMLLQIHDELIFEVPGAEAERAQTLVAGRMEGVYSLDVPVLVDLGLGRHWAEAH